MSEYILEVNNITKRYPHSDNDALNGVSFNVKKGSITVIIGPSGSGKSTLLRCCTQLETFTEGSIKICGIKLHNSEEDNKKALSYSSLVFQNYNLFPHWSVLENVSKPLIKVQGKSIDESEKISLRVLNDLGLADKKDTYPCFLSGGQMQRVSIARSLALNPKILFFDEPTSALDPELIQDFFEIIRILNKKGMTLIIVSHDMKLATDLATDIVFLEKGNIIVSGTKQEVIEQTDKSQRLKKFINLSNN